MHKAVNVNIWQSSQVMQEIKIMMMNLMPALNMLTEITTAIMLLIVTYP